jgi:hypothetical protein
VYKPQNYLTLNIAIMKSITLFSWVLLLVFSTSCKKTNTVVPAATVVYFTSSMNGASEVPANGSTATGNATASFDKTTKILSLTMSYSGVTATNMHIHKAPAGVSGAVLFGIGTTPFASPINYSSPALSAGQEDSLMNNLYYLNIHSAAFGAGEIRGQLLKQ